METTPDSGKNAQAHAESDPMPDAVAYKKGLALNHGEALQDVVRSDLSAVAQELWFQFRLKYPALGMCRR